MKLLKWFLGKYKCCKLMLFLICVKINNKQLCKKNYHFIKIILSLYSSSIIHIVLFSILNFIDVKKNRKYRKLCCFARKIINITSLRIKDILLYIYNFVLCMFIYLFIYKKLKTLNFIVILHNWPEEICYDSLRFKDWLSQRDKQKYFNTRINCGRKYTRKLFREKNAIWILLMFWHEILLEFINIYWKRYLLSSLLAQ